MYRLYRRLLLIVVALAAAPWPAAAQVPVTLRWDHPAPSTVTGYRVAIDGGAARDYGTAPSGAGGACGCSVALTLAPGSHTFTVTAYNSDGATASAGLTDTVDQPTAPPALPGPAGSPSPVSGATGVSTSATLTWSATGASSYEIRFGTSNPPATAISNQAAPSYQPALSAGTRYFWQVIARNSAGATAGPVWSFTTGSTPTTDLPALWTSEDIGNVGLAGSAIYAAGTFTVAAAGVDIWGRSEAFQYVFQPLAANDEIVAHITALQNTNADAKAGVMMRGALTASAQHALINVRTDGSVEFTSRPTAGGETELIGASRSPGLTWLKLTRTGTTITGSVSSDGQSWSAIGSTTVAGLGYAGLVVSSANPAILNVATFTSVSITDTAGSPPPPTGLPSPWSTEDIGIVGVTGSATYSNGTFTVAGGGLDIWGTADAFRYVFQPMTGDGEIVARVTALQNTHANAKAGVMMRGGLTASAPHVMLNAAVDGSIEFMSRSGIGRAATQLGGGTQPRPTWLKLTRSGSTITGSVSSNGREWSEVGSTSVSGLSYAGLVVTSADLSERNVSTFDSVRVSTGSGKASPSGDIVIYAGDVAQSGLNGSWQQAADPTSPSGVKLTTSNLGVTHADQPLASPTDYLDLSFNADAGTPYTVWLRLGAANNNRSNDSVWLQFSDAQVDGTPIYGIGSSSGLLVTLATDATGSSLNQWGWQNGAYWLSQPTTITFAASGQHTIRIQVREDGVQLDQIVLSPSSYLTQAPGQVSGDLTIVPK
jgi:hypothetical protein